MDKDLEKREAEELLFADPSEEQIQKELQELKRKREEYQKQQELELKELREEKKRAKRRNLYSVAKVAVLVLVVGTCFVMFTMRSEATRMWWLKFADREIGQESENVVDNDDARIVSNMDEKEAVSEIEEKTGIPMPELIYKPNGMIFDGYECSKEAGRGYLYYICDDYIVSLKVFSPEKNASYSSSFDGEIIKEDTIEAEYGKVLIQEIKSKDDKKSAVIATWEYQNHQYMIEGKIDFEEIRKIIENIFY